MPEYVFWYDDSSTYKAGFTASNLEEAQKLIDKVVIEGEMLLEELPGFWSKHKANEIEVSGDLEEIE